MNQVLRQFNLQLFAEETAEAVTDDVSAAEESATEEADTNPSFGDMDGDSQVDYVAKHFLGDDEETAASENNAPTQPERKVTLTHNGQQVQVSESEAINLAMQGYDYTKKMQALAEERRHYEQLIAQMTAGQQTQQAQPQNPLDAGYEAAVAATEKALGLNQGEFNQFDPKHLYVLQQMAVRQREEYYAQQQQAQERQEVNQAMARLDKIIKAEPMRQQIIDNYENYLFKYVTNAEGAVKAANIGQALNRYYQGRCVKGDDKLLEEHWNFVKKDLQRKAKGVTQPPVTESPGVGTSNNAPHSFNKGKVRALADNPDAQLKYLMESGVLD